MKKLTFILIIFLYSCSPDPYKVEKAEFIKTINTTGNTELIRDVKIEKFEPSTVLMLLDAVNYVDTLLIAKNEELRTTIFPKMIAYHKENYHKYRAEYNKSKKRKYYESVSNMYLSYYKSAESGMEQYQAKLDSANQGLYAEDYAKRYEKLKTAIKKIGGYIGDTISYSFDIVFVIEDKRVSDKFTFSHDGVSIGEQDVLSFVQPLKEKVWAREDSLKDVEHQRQIDNLLVKHQRQIDNLLENN